jgi:hypothetical protein
MSSAVRWQCPVQIMYMYMLGSTWQSPFDARPRRGPQHRVDWVRVAHTTAATGRRLCVQLNHGSRELNGFGSGP